MKWGLVIASRAKRRLRRLSTDDRDQIDAAFSAMCEDPFNGDVKFLQGLGALRRRVGDWRILFELDEKKKDHLHRGSQTARIEYLLIAPATVNPVLRPRLPRSSTVDTRSRWSCSFAPSPVLPQLEMEKAFIR